MPTPQEIRRDGRAQIEQNDLERRELLAQNQPARELGALRTALGAGLCRLPPAEAGERYRLDGQGALSVIRRAAPFADFDNNALGQALHGLNLKGPTVDERTLVFALRKELIGALVAYAEAPVPGDPHGRQAYLKGPWASAGPWVGIVRDIDRPAPAFALDYKRLAEAESLEAPPEPVVPRPGLEVHQAAFEARVAAAAPTPRGKKPK